MDHAPTTPQRWTAAFLPALVEYAVRKLAPTRVWLFGSRARGDFKPTSDVDLAFDGAFTPLRFGAFASVAKEDARTLLPLDLVDMNRCAPELRHAIETEGVLLYAVAETSR